jgi:hypothetical protein
MVNLAFPQRKCQTVQVLPLSNSDKMLFRDYEYGLAALAVAVAQP